MTSYQSCPSENEITKLDAEIAQSQIRMNKVLKEIRSQTKTSPEIIDSAESYEREFWESIDGLLEDKITVDENGDLTKTDSIIDLLDYKDANRVNKNIRSVAVLLTFGSHNAILGADLEVGQKDNGWHAVLSSQCLKNVQANAFKIPHHGSKTGYFQEFIDTHIKKGATSQLSPWINGSHKLPEPTTRKQYYDHSNNMFITTTNLLKSKNSETDRSIKKIMDEYTEDIFEIVPQIGIIQSRIDIDAALDIWETKIYGSADKLTEEIIDLF